MAGLALKVDAGGPVKPNLVRQDNLQNLARPERLIAPPLPRLTLQEVAPRDPLRAAFDSLPVRATRADLRLLMRNVDAWLGMWHVLSTAPDGVDASYFILERDVFGMSFLGAMLLQARQNKRVRLLVDSAGDYLRLKGFTLPGRGGDYLQELVAAGADVRIYNPMHKKLFRSGFARIANNHDKLVRSRIMAQTGGRNVAKDYLSHGDDLDERVYRDTCVLIEGERTSKELEKAFEREFHQDRVVFKQFPDLFGNWRKRDGELLGAYLMMDSWLSGRLGRVDFSDRERIAGRILEDVLARFPEVGFDREPSWLTMRSLRKRARELADHVHLYGTYPAFAAAPSPHRNVEVKVLDRTSAATEGHDRLTSAIRTAACCASDHIRIHTPYLTLSEDSIRALEIASRRGVKIELLTNSPASTDSVLTQALFLEDWPRLLARIPNLRIFVLAGDQKLHAKSIEVDGKMTFVKSYNLDMLSERVNSELGIAAWSESFAKEASSVFDRDLAERTNAIREYLIRRDAGKRPVLDAKGEPIVELGAKDHVEPAVWRKYERWRWLVRQVRKLPGMEQHQRPALLEARAGGR
jgi:phosphatidylserine/phosphatidylglycerophosphate/cardiolipin synthase-like enzyme